MEGDGYTGWTFASAPDEAPEDGDPSPAAIRVLLISDSAAGCEPVLAELRAAGAETELAVVVNGEQLRAILPADVDVIISSIELPQFTAAEALSLIVAHSPNLPVIVLARACDAATAAALMKGGASDYIAADRLPQSADAILRSIERLSLLRELEFRTAALDAVRTQQSLVLDAIADGVLSLHRDGSIQFANPAGAKMLGWSPRDLVGQFGHAAIHRLEQGSEEHTPDSCPMYITLRSGQIRAAKRETFWRKNGTSFPVEYISAPLKNTQGEILGAVITFRDISERIRAERNLRRSELLFRELSDAMPQIVWAASADGRLDYFNQQALLYTGRAHEELVASGWVHLIHPDDIAHTRSTWRRALETGGNYESEYRLRRASDGCYRWHLVRALPVRDANGAIVRWFGTSTDIDDQKAAQETLRRSQENLAIAQRVAQIGSWESRLDADIHDPNLTLTWSDETFRIFGLTPETGPITQGRVFEFVPPGEHEMLRAALDQMMTKTDALAVEHRVVLPDGRERIVYERATLFRRADGSPERIVGTVQDITERRQAEDLLRQQAEMLNLAHDAIIVRDFATEKVVFWNSGAERLYGWTAAEAVGRPIGELMGTDAKERAAALTTLVSSGEFGGELRNVTKHGREVTVNVRSTLVRDAGGDPRSVLSINTDVTEHKKLEQQFLRAQRLESIGTLASGVAHDLNNILAPILMSAPLLREGLPPATTEKIIATIEESAERGAQIVKQVLTFARGVEGERVLIDPAHLVKEMAHIAQETFPRSIRISTRYPDDLWPIEGDPTQLHQVLLNLSVNARDAMPNGGTLVLSAVNFVVDEHYASMMPDAAPGPHVVLRAQDSGSGIPRELMDKIFDPFFTTKPVGKGTGLGLSTVLGIVRSHGGFVSVSSEPASGTIVEAFIPSRMASRPAGKTTPKAQMPRGNGETILVIDDEPSIATVTKLMLENHNYRVITASDGPEALAIFAQQMSSIDLVITDMMMPYMDGIAVIRALRRLSPGVPVIASSGQGDQAGDAELQELRVSASLIKPYDISKLLSTLQQLLPPQHAP